jgi:hypothetical protein
MPRRFPSVGSSGGGIIRCDIVPITPAGNRRERDTRGVTTTTHHLRMNLLLECPWCEDVVAFSVDLADEELICTACNTRMDLAPDPLTTFDLLYGATQQAA